MKKFSDQEMYRLLAELIIKAIPYKNKYSASYFGYVAEKLSDGKPTKRINVLDIQGLLVNHFGRDYLGVIFSNIDILIEIDFRDESIKEDNGKPFYVVKLGKVLTDIVYSIKGTEGLKEFEQELMIAYASTRPTQARIRAFLSTMEEINLLISCERIESDEE